MIFIFLVVSILLVVLQTKREKNIGNMLSFLILPYILLVFINNFFMYQYGFYRIGDDVLLMLTGAFTAFFIGSCIPSANSVYVISESGNNDRFYFYNIKKMVNYLYIIVVFASAKLIVLLAKGNITSGELGNGVVGHLLLTCYAVVPIVFLYWTYNKKEWKYLFAVCLVIAMNFATFIKYNFISLIVCVFIFTLMYKKSATKKACLLLISIVFVMFVANYIIGFVLSGVIDDVQQTFYLNHFWKYCSGSLIYDNYIFTTGINVGMSIFEKLACFIFALPNMFLYGIFGIRIFAYEIMSMLPVSELGEYSNVTDAIGYMFPSQGGAIEIIGFLLFFIGIGILFSVIYYRSKRKKHGFSPFVANFLTFFCFLSFFGTFYVNSGPWEILVWSIIVPYFFRSQAKKL